MSPGMIGLIGLLSLLGMLAFRVPVAIAMVVVGLAGVWSMRNQTVALSYLASETFTVASQAEFAVIPLFILMGNVATESGMSRRLYDAAYSWLGGFRGGLASATVVGCAGFSALSGSSVASAMTMGRVSLGEMERFNYSPRLATGSVAAGGTLGILIPPSTGFVLYAILTQESIGRLFLAGVIPGLMLTGLFVLTIWLLALWNPGLGPRGPRTTLAATVAALPVMGLVLATIGGIYTGLFSPVEAAAVGALLAILHGLATRGLSLAGLLKALTDSVATTAAVMLILIGAHVFGPFLAMTGVPTAVGNFLTGLDLGPTGVLIAILLCYVVLGCFLKGFSMLVLTLPIFFPVVTALGFDPIWFGVVIVLVLEMGLITPPVGVNVFIVKSVAPKVPLSEVFIGVAPFLVAMVVMVILLIVWPDIALFLPRSMIG
jgi:tripartite ATP-independent transporter DctM subunit